MSALADNEWNSRQNSEATAIPLPDSSEERNMRYRMRVLRDTVLVLGIQLVFRFTLFLRRWNY
jgi:hypothetical protein